MTGLCAIYACDVLSFLPFPQLEKCRLVSRAYNFTINANLTRLPARRRLQMAIISVEEAASTEFTLEGYVMGEHLVQKRLEAALQDCCGEELEEAARSIAGELIFHHCAQTDRVTINVFPSAGWDSMGFAARNELSSETAFCLLHLFEHLRDTYLHWIGISRKSNPAGKMNQAIFKLLSRPGDQYKLRVQTMPGSSLHAGDWKRDLPLRIRQCEWILPIDGIARMMDFALRARRHCDCIFSQDTEVPKIIEVLEHLKSTLTRIGTDVVRTWRFHLGPNRMQLDDLPVGILDKVSSEELMDYPGASTSTGYSSIHYSRRLPNQHSGEQFNLMLKCIRTPEGVEVAKEVQLNF